MAPRATQKTEKQSKLKQKTVKFGSLPTSTTARTYDPLTAFSATPDLTNISRSQNVRLTSQNASKGKGKAREDIIDLTSARESTDDRLWVDIHEPTTEAELAVHIRKVEDVRRWFTEAFNGGPSGKLRKYRRILVLTGPAGTAKTATVRVLARELGFEMLEWRNSIGDTFAAFDNELMDYANNGSYETLMTKFETFFNRASNCQNFLTSLDDSRPLSTQSSQLPSSSSEGSRNTSGRKIILLEDLPNVLHLGTQARFHAVLRSFAETLSEPPVPIVIIISDTQTVGEANDERVARGRYRNADGEGVMDIRTVLPRDLLGGPYVTSIKFNPIAPTLLRKALQGLVNTHFALNKSAQPSKDVLDVVVETANGDIRSAIMALQFACGASIPNGKTRKKRDAKLTTLMLESITRREQSLVLFHLLGKVLYNKRKGDPSSSSASAKDVQKEKMLDALIPDPPKLPRWLSDHDRRASRVDVDALYASTPIDSDLFSLYIHQNYTEFATEIEECDGVADWLSWVDSSGGETWYQANPYRFHLLTLGTLHSLPSPVPRRNQKVVKPEFFEYREKEKEAWGTVHDVRNWVVRRTNIHDDDGWRICAWTTPEIATELGGVLKAFDSCQQLGTRPRSHQNFSRMVFQRDPGASRYHHLGEDELNPIAEKDHDAWDVGNKGDNADEAGGGWLENDDIEEF
ncbi:Rad17 cell cycle checkpoint protein-domain-containing protein [Amanita rubescens]|nr:Rad17 cell cycle checkpoint protein-domain-containing protein [Amanita rubescens]